VKVPVWIAPLDDKLVMYTDARTYKVKRIMNNPRVRMARCNASGKKILGPWYEGTARIVPKEDHAPGLAALDTKYGWQIRLFNFVARLTGRVGERVLIEITVGVEVA
jgi:PPOX class probable F420-dependent enzyme